MIFRTFDSDLDGISNKLGFSKRSFSEWIKQVKASFIQGTNVLQKFKNTLSTAFISTKNGENNTWITNSSGQIISNDNIDLYLPKLEQVPASNLLRNMKIKNGKLILFKITTFKQQAQKILLTPMRLLVLPF